MAFIRALGRTPAWRAWQAIVLFVVSAALALGLLFAYIDKVDRENERRDIQRARELCSLFRLIDDVNQRAPAPAADAPNRAEILAYRAEIHRLRGVYDCDRK